MVTIDDLQGRLDQCRSRLDVLLQTKSPQVIETADKAAKSGQATREEYLVLDSIAEAISCALSQSPSTSAISSVLIKFLSKSEQALAKAQQKMVLDFLKFTSINARFEDVTGVQDDSFKWLLGDEEIIALESDTYIPLAQDLAQNKQRFVRWLNYEDGIFYISGKPGAGKSTLMKFIYHNANFHRHLDVWAAGSTLLIGKFFFWKPGQEEQKSINGLLRGLLYSLLESSPILAAAAFPKLCETLCEGSSRQTAITDKAVQKAFENILADSATNKKYKIVLVIDGLDEFEADHADLLAMFDSWVLSYPSVVKICVSSREYQIFEDFFSDHPKMRLHDLTRKDMAQLIERRLKKLGFLSVSAHEDSIRIRDLIIKRAEGAFLWVVMVIATIEDGILTRDIKNTSELERKVQLCPSELDDLLPHLLGSVTAHHRSWAYRAISLVQFSQFKVPNLLNSSQIYPGVGVLDLMLLDEASPTWNLSTFQPRSDTKLSDMKTRLEVNCKNILGRCKGFISIVTVAKAKSWPGNGDERTYAALTHRSIVEFLGSDIALSQMGIYLTDFDPFCALFSTVLACLRFLPPTYYALLKPNERIPDRESLETVDVLEDSLQDRLRELIRCGLLVGHSGSPRFLGLLDATGDAIKRHLTMQLINRKERLPLNFASPNDLLVLLTLAEGVNEYSEWRKRQAVPTGKVMRK